MSKMIKRAILCGMVATYIFTTADATVKRPALREISSTDAELSSFPDTGVLKSGALEASEQYFDLFCSGSYSDEKSPALIIEGFNVIPNPVKVDKGGKLVVANPQPMGTIRLSEGHSGWVHITLQAVSNPSNYLCLGITRRGRKEGNWQLFDADGHKEKYIGMEDSDILEFFPLISLTEVTKEYTAVKEGEVVSDDIPDFSSTYRVQAAYAGEILSRQYNSDLSSKGGASDSWDNCGSVAVGPIKNEGNRLLIVNWGANGKLAYSQDGITWTSAGSVANDGSNTWDAGPKYGNGIWCAVNYSGKIIRSVDNAITWQNAALLDIEGAYAFAFGGEMFMIISENIVYTSTDAITWEPVGTVSSDGNVQTLGYGDGKWICCDTDGNEYSSKDGSSWIQFTPNVTKFKIGGIPYMNGYFYMITPNPSDGGKVSSIIKSSDGTRWTKVADVNCDSRHMNIACFDNKIYLFDSKGKHTHIFYLPDSDDPI